MIAIFVALINAIGIIVVGYFTYKGIKETNKKLETSNGKNVGQYVEEIAKLQNSDSLQEARINHLANKIETSKEEILEAFKIHERDDIQRFTLSHLDFLDLKEEIKNLNLPQ